MTSLVISTGAFILNLITVGVGVAISLRRSAKAEGMFVQRMGSMEDMTRKMYNLLYPDPAEKGKAIITGYDCWRTHSDCWEQINRNEDAHAETTRDIFKRLNTVENGAERREALIENIQREVHEGKKNG